jgi:hypothetical protein
LTWEDAQRPGGPRRWLLPAVAVTALLALAAVALASRGDDRGLLAVGPASDPPRSPDPGANGPTTLPVTRLEPLEITSEVRGRGIGVPSAEGLTLVAERRDQLALIDAATGGVRHIRLPPSSRPPPGLDGMFTAGSDLIVNHHGSVLRISAGDDRPVLLAEGHRAVPTHDSEGSIWVSDGLLRAVASTAMRIAPDGTVLERVRLPAIVRPIAGTGDGLVVSDHGGISVVDAGGGEEIDADGELVATDGEHIAWVDCQVGVRCVVVLGTVDDPDRTRVPLDPEDIPAGYFGLATGTFSPDGRWMAFPRFRVDGSGALERPWITVVDTTTGAEVFRVRGAFTQDNSILPLAWSPDSRWLFVASAEGMATWNSATHESATSDLDLESPRGLAVLPGRWDGG